MITITIDNRFLPEKKYLCETFFGEFLGVPYQLNVQDSQQDYYLLEGKEGSIVIKDYFFSKLKEGDTYLKEENIPKITTIFDSNEFFDKDLVIIYGCNKLDVFENQSSLTKITVHLDIFGSTFFMLTRWEEYVSNIREKHNRFPGRSSLAYRNNFIDRPVVNEYIVFLSRMLLRIDANLNFKQRKYELIPTHDIDHPLWGFKKSFKSYIRSFFADIIIRKDIILAFQRVLSYVRSKQKDYSFDPANKFNFIMTTSENANLRSRFYFISDFPAGIIDGQFPLDHPFAGRLFQEIHTRGHEIGLHPSYLTYLDGDQTIKEYKLLIDVIAKNKISNKVQGTRQHYLRLEVPTTLRNLDSIGFKYDSSLGYFDIPGFRCGICYSFQIFDFITRTTLSMKELPLVLMDQTVLVYGKMSKKEILTYTKQIASHIRDYNGKFVILWHNTRLQSKSERKLYSDIIAIAR